MSSEERRIARVEILADNLLNGARDRLRDFLVAVIKEDGLDDPEVISKLAQRGAELRSAVEALEAMGAYVADVHVFRFGIPTVEIAPPKLGLAAAIREHCNPFAVASPSHHPMRTPRRRNAWHP